MPLKRHPILPSNLQNSVDGSGLDENPHLPVRILKMRHNFPNRLLKLGRPLQELFQLDRNRPGQTYANMPPESFARS